MLVETEETAEVKKKKKKNFWSLAHSFFRTLIFLSVFKNCSECHLHLTVFFQFGIHDYYKLFKKLCIVAQHPGRNLGNTL